jgi:hypothetical protein
MCGMQKRMVVEKCNAYAQNKFEHDHGGGDGIKRKLNLD